MGESKKEKLFALIGAICFAIYAIWLVFRDLKVEASYRHGGYITWVNIVYWLIFIAFAVLLFLRKKSIIFLIPPALATIMEIREFFAYRKLFLNTKHSYEDLVLAIIYALLFVLLLINVVPSMKKICKATRVLCFVPAGIYFVKTLFFAGDWVWTYSLVSLVNVAGCLFLGLWLRETLPDSRAAAQRKFKPAFENAFEPTFGAQMMATQGQRALVCENCGKELDENAIICGYCGKSVPKNNLSNETVKRIQENEYSDASLKKNTGFTIRLWGEILMSIGILCDVISMFFIDGDYIVFSILIPMGTIAFLVGLILAFAFRG